MNDGYHLLNKKTPNFYIPSAPLRNVFDYSLQNT